MIVVSMFGRVFLDCSNFDVMFSSWKFAIYIQRN